MTEGVMVKLELTIGVTTVVLRIVLVLVVDTITGVCRQEQTREISEAGRDRMLEKMLAWTDGIACLLAKGAVIISRGVAVLVVVVVTVSVTIDNIDVTSVSMVVSWSV
jgi:hypothetical protein